MNVRKIIAWTTIILFGCTASANAQYAFKGKINGYKQSDDTLFVSLKNGKFSQTKELILPDNKFSFTGIPEGYYLLSVIRKGFVHHIGTVHIYKNTYSDLEFHYSDTLKEVVVKSVKSAMPKNDDLISFDIISNAKKWISKRQIELLGSQRLDEVLKEQPGITVVNDLGAGNRAVGIQMQGFSSEYIKILLDGMPVAGRINGNLDLSRFSVQDIDHIEIIKGATSVLYGADAMGGVINIITAQNATGRQASAAFNYGSFNTCNADAGYAGTFGKRKSFYRINEDFYKTDGFNANPQYLLGGQTTPPYLSNTLQARTRIDVSDKDNINISARYSFRNSAMWRNYGDNYITTDKLNDNDLNVLTSWNHTIDNRSQFLIRYYLTHYYSDEQVSLQNTGGTAQTFRFGEWEHQIEGQYRTQTEDKRLGLVSGAGIVSDKLQGYANMQSGQQYNYFAYGQLTYQPMEKLKLNGGARATGNSVYGGKITPAFGVEWNPVRQLTVRPSYGMGFKSPTYAQMNQVFTNLAQGYTVIGANIFSTAAAALDAAGQIGSLWAAAASVKPLKAEISHSCNMDIKWNNEKWYSLEANIFYNHIQNMIFTEQVGIKTNGAQLFSYANLAQVVNKGVELYGSLQPAKGFHLDAGYQLLYSQDISVLDSIKDGKLTVRANPIRIATVKDYFNLPNRSRNMLQLHLFYDNADSRWSASFRANYRGKYGFMDLDNNGFIDPYDVYVNGFWILNAGIQYKFLQQKNLRIMFSVDNIGNTTNYLMPYQSGRSYRIGVDYNFLR